MRLRSRRGAAWLAVLVAACAVGERARAETEPVPAPPVDAPVAPPPPAWPGPLYSELTPSPPTVMVHRKRRGLIASGIIVFSVAHATSLFFTLYSDCSTRETAAEQSMCETGSRRFWIPFIGPWLANSADSAGSSHPNQDRAVAAVWGLVEVAGAVMIVVGAIGRDVPDRPPSRARAMWDLVPTGSRDGAGLTFRATF
jgi:hypothetical protein